ncbi:hypothetical protein C8Q74DRAFT_1215124 [Fomes fomentarius]|nr:hypothetical protein C8Q74DRAFT_1215124 [Fomes fomentarius]
MYWCWSRSRCRYTTSSFKLRLEEWVTRDGATMHGRDTRTGASGKQGRTRWCGGLDMRRDRTGYETGCYKSHRQDERGESDSLRTEAVNPEGRNHGETEDEGENEKSIKPVKTVRESKRMQRRMGREEDTATADSTWVSMRFDHCQGACDRTEGCTGKEQESGSKDEGCDVDAMAERRREVMVLNMSQGACGMVVDRGHRGHRLSQGGVQREERESASCCTLRRPGREARVETCILAMFSTSAANLRGCADCAPASYAPFGLPPQVVREVSTDARFPRRSLRRGKARRSERNGPEERGWRAGLTYSSGCEGGSAARVKGEGEAKGSGVDGDREEQRPKEGARAERLDISQYRGTEDEVGQGSGANAMYWRWVALGLPYNKVAVVTVVNQWEKGTRGIETTYHRLVSSVRLLARLNSAPDVTSREHRVGSLRLVGEYDGRRRQRRCPGSQCHVTLEVESCVWLSRSSVSRFSSPTALTSEGGVQLECYTPNGRIPALTDRHNGDFVVRESQRCACLRQGEEMVTDDNLKCHLSASSVGPLLLCLRFGAQPVLLHPRWHQQLIEQSTVKQLLALSGSTF